MIEAHGLVKCYGSRRPGPRAAFRASTFGDVLRSEWTKFRSVRSTFWALTVTVVVGIGLGAVISAATAHGYARFSASSTDPRLAGAGSAAPDCCSCRACSCGPA